MMMSPNPNNIERLLRLKNRLQKIKSGERIEPYKQLQESETSKNEETGQEPSSPQHEEEIMCLDDEDDVVCIDEDKSEGCVPVGVGDKTGLKSLNNCNVNTAKDMDGEIKIVSIEAGSNGNSHARRSNRNLRRAIKPVIKLEGVNFENGSQVVGQRCSSNRNFKKVKTINPEVEIVDVEVKTNGVVGGLQNNKCCIGPQMKTVDPEVEILEIENGCNGTGSDISNKSRPNEIKTEMKSMKPAVETEGFEDETKDFVHFTLDSLYRYLSDHKWLEIVKNDIIKKYNIAPNEMDQINLPLLIFFDTVKGLDVIDSGRKFVQVAIEALYLKTLFRNSGVLSITAWLLQNITPTLVTKKVMTTLYLIHVIMSTEMRLFTSNEFIQSYRDALQKMKFGQRFKEIVIRAPLMMKKELYSLRLRWNSILSNQVLMLIDKENFWIQQGLNLTYMQFKSKMYSQSLMTAAGVLNGNQTIKSETQQTSQPEIYSGPSIKPKRRRRLNNCKKAKSPIANKSASAKNDTSHPKLVEVVTVDDNSNDDICSDVEIVQEFKKKRNKLIENKRRQAAIRKKDSEVQQSSSRLNGNCSTSKEKPDNEEIIITSSCSLAPSMNAKPNATISSVPSTVNSSSSISRLSQKTDLVLVNGKLVPKLDGKCKKTVTELQKMLMRKRGAPIKRVNYLNPVRNGLNKTVVPTENKNVRQVQVTNVMKRNVPPTENKNVRQVQVINVMSKEFVDNLLTPTLANFEIVYGDDGTAQTKFTHMA